MFLSLSLCFPGYPGQGSNTIMLCPNQIMVNHPDTHTCHSQEMRKREIEGGGETRQLFIVQTDKKTSYTEQSAAKCLSGLWMVNSQYRVIVLLREGAHHQVDTSCMSLLSSHYDTLFILSSSQSQPSDVRPIMEAMEDVNKQWEADTVTTIEASLIPRPWLQNISSFSYHQGMSREGGPGCVRINLWVKALNIVMKASN